VPAIPARDLERPIDVLLRKLEHTTEGSSAPGRRLRRPDGVRGTFLQFFVVISE
jgi:hypothetical protein